MQKGFEPVVSVVIPAYNEAGSIAKVITKTEKALGSINLPYEVIVVDDGSVDRTKHLASGNGARVISYHTNKGKGHALRTGISNAKGKILVTIDADGSHRPEEIPRIVRHIIRGADVVIGSRFSGKNGKMTSRINVLGNRFFNILIRIITGKQISDSQSGFRAFRRKVLRGIVLFSEGYEIETELTIKSLRNGFKIQEEPISCDKRRKGKSNINPFVDGLSILKTIIKSSLF